MTICVSKGIIFSKQFLLKFFYAVSVTHTMCNYNPSTNLTKIPAIKIVKKLYVGRRSASLL